MKEGEGIFIISLDHIQPGLKVAFKDAKKRFYRAEDYLQNNEAEFQFTEGVYYAYEFYNDLASGEVEWKLDLTSGLKGIFQPFSSLNPREGTFAPNTFVGTLKVLLLRGEEKAHFHVEVHSSKIDYQDKENLKNKLGEYRSEYQLMMEEIVAFSTDLVIQYNVPIEQAFESGTEQISENELYQRFIFVRSLFKNQEFDEAVQKIISNPATKWEREFENRDVRGIRRFTSKNIRDLASGPNRINLKKPIGNLSSLPVKISSSRKVESVDTPENRFIKHILTSFQDFCESILPKLEKANLTQESQEVNTIVQKLENLLHQSFFSEIQRPTSLKINSPILQRRSGYRELLLSWLRFHLTAQLNWSFDPDQDNLFTGGKKDVASLYEYWVFFILLNTLLEKYGDLSKKNGQEWISKLIVPNKDGLSLMLQEGKTQAFEFEYSEGKRPLIIKYYYNRSFPGGRKYTENNGRGSYSKAFRPDYTLSIWPSGMKELEAEKNESIVHIHFDAKYKVDYSFFREEKLKQSTKVTDEDWVNLSDEKRQQKEEIEASEIVQAIEKEERQGVYKNVDLYKMHAYKDAIRRSGGAYVLYPGTLNEDSPFRGFHEIIPGVGAFSLRPNNEAQASENIKQFIDKVILNLEDVLSQREQIAKKAKLIYAQKPLEIKDEKLDQLCRELNSDSNPSETNVLVGYYKNAQHLKWIENSLLYNIRFGEKYPINADMLSSKYLVMYGNSKFEHTYIYELDLSKSKLMRDDELLGLSHPYPSKPSQNYYFVYKLKRKIDLDELNFDEQNQIIKDKLANSKFTFLPFTLTLSELAQIRVAK